MDTLEPRPVHDPQDISKNQPMVLNADYTAVFEKVCLSIDINNDASPP